MYNSSKSNISEHIKHIFEEHELEEDSVVRKFRTTAKDGKSYNIKYYNLDMIVAIGFRVKSNIGTNFRIWANERLTEYIQKGFTMNDDLLKRADGNKDFMGLTSFEGKIPSFYETTIAKNYLTERELDILNRIVSMYLDYAELQAIEGRAMKMADWIEELNYFLTMNRKDILKDSGKISHEYAMSHVEKEYNIFKERINSLPSDVEIHYLESINELKKIGDKNNKEDE